jgi:glycosyltransferase involved in cell wall biosynthesis
MKKHTFAICAYKESQYLEECIKSVKKQEDTSEIILVTSTPNDYISNLCEKYDIPMFINKGEHGITQDWNFAYSCAKTKYVTITHQDDVYYEGYSKTAIQRMEQSKHPLIYFTNYDELRDGVRVSDNKLLKVKRLMLKPLIKPSHGKSIFIRRRVLSFGCPICCPSVAYAKENLPEKIFQSGFRSCEDWEAWEKLSKIKGDFMYDTEIRMSHRIHEESETSLIIGDNARSKEEYVMYSKFWPKFIVKLLVKFYSTSQTSNNL